MCPAHMDQWVAEAVILPLTPSFCAWAKCIVGRAVEKWKIFKINRLDFASERPAPKQWVSRTSRDVREGVTKKGAEFQIQRSGP